MSGILIIAENKKARRNFEIRDVFEAGIALLGSEVKSIRDGGITLNESYVRIKDGEAFLLGCHISPYKFSRLDAYNPTRERKLLLHKSEIDKIQGAVQQKGFTLIPTRVYFKSGRCKLEFGLAKGKKLHDKRQDIKTKEARREIERVLKRKK